MKNRCLALLVSALVLAVSSVPVQAQDLVFSGAVIGVSPDAGTMILTNGPNVRMTLTGLHQARIRAVDGRLVGLESLRPGMRVSVAYLKQGREWVVSRVLVPSLAQPTVTPLISDPRYQSLFDGDATTNPGSKAAVDGDITTNPGSKAAIDRDITTKPAGNANRDGDRMTKSDR